MTYQDLYVACVNIRNGTKVYIYNENEGAYSIYNARDLIKKFGNHKIKWFSFWNEENIEVKFE